MNLRRTFPMMRRVALGSLALIVIAIGSACDDEAVRHPLDDSETRPTDLDAALEQANAALDDVADAVLDGVAGNDRQWPADGGCGTNPDSPEQGDVSRILYRSYPTLAAGSTPAGVVSAAGAHWEQAGHSVGPGAPNMANQAITRIDGIGYSVVEAPPGVELRAFLPCLVDRTPVENDPDETWPGAALGPGIPEEWT